MDPENQGGLVLLALEVRIPQQEAVSTLKAYLCVWVTCGGPGKPAPPEKEVRSEGEEAKKAA